MAPEGQQGADRHAIRSGSGQSGTERDAEGGKAIEADLFRLCFATEDQTEGMSGFLEKKPTGQVAEVCR